MKEPKCLKKMTSIIKFFNDNYDTNHPLVIECLNRYFGSSHCYKSTKMDGYHAEYQPSFPEKTVFCYKIYYDTEPLIKQLHKTGRIKVDFTDGTEYDISLYKFKKYLRRIYQYKILKY